MKNLSEVRHLDLGCGSDCGRIPRLLDKEVKALGVDLDLSKYNLDNISIELLLRAFDTEEIESLRSFSVYPFYSKIGKLGKSKVARADFVQYLTKTVLSGLDTKAISSDDTRYAGVREQLVQLHQRLTQDGFIVPQEGLNLPKIRKKDVDHSVEADLLELLPRLSDGQLERVYADYFLLNLHSAGMSHEAVKIIQGCRDKLANNGVIELVEPLQFMEERTAQLLANGFVVDSEPRKIDPYSEKGRELSLRTQGFLRVQGFLDELNPARMQDINHGYLSTFKKV